MENRIEDVEEIDTLIAELEISKDGNLILCVVNSPLYRDRIIQTLRGRFSSKVIVVKKGEQIIDILKRKDFDSADVLMWVMPEEPTEDLLNTLNNFRELFYEGKIPNVMFYNQAFSENVIRKAPDFWRYRGNYYEFKEEEGGLTFEALEALATPLTYKDKDDLLRRKRINEYLLEKVRDKEEKSKILSELGIINDDLGKLDEALEYFEKALKLDEELGKKERIAYQLGNVGIVYREKGELVKALEYQEKALKLDEESGDREGVAAHLGSIGIIYRKKGELDKALEYQEKALKLNEVIGNKQGMANDFVMIGNVYLIKREFDKALEHYEKALKLDEELGRKDGIAMDVANMGVIHRTKGKLNEALEYFMKALIIFKEMGSRIRIAQTLLNIGDIFVLKNEKKRAVDYYLEGQNLASGSPVLEMITKRLKILQDEENVKRAKQKTQV